MPPFFLKSNAQGTHQASFSYWTLPIVLTIATSVAFAQIPGEPQKTTPEEPRPRTDDQAPREGILKLSAVSEQAPAIPSGVKRRYVHTFNSPGLGHFDEIYEVEGNMVTVSLKIYRLNPGVALEGMFTSQGEFFLGSALVDSIGNFPFRFPSGSRFEYQLSANGTSITKKQIYSSRPNLPVNPSPTVIPRK